jgi:thiol-disulfide isomerase/thioredoxin
MSTRRGLLIGAVAAGSALAGGWWATRRSAAAALEQRLWSSSFVKPDGGSLAMASLRGRPLVLNFWAAWCAPCIREMPTLDRFRQAYAPVGWEVLGLAIDRPEAVTAFLAKRPVGFPIALAGIEGAELARELGNEQGGLPFTAVFDANGRHIHSHLGETHYEQLVAFAR